MDLLESPKLIRNPPYLVAMSDLNTFYELNLQFWSTSRRWWIEHVESSCSLAQSAVAKAAIEHCETMIVQIETHLLAKPLDR